MNTLKRQISRDTAGEARRRASAITLGFLLASAIYIAVSSWFLTEVFADPKEVVRWEIIKGILYVTLSAAVLHFFIRRGLADVASVREELHQVINTMPDAFLSLDSQRRFTFLNRKAAEIYRHSQKELVGRPIQEYTSADNTGTIAALIDAAVASQKVWREQMRAPITGVWYELTAYPRGDEVSIFLHNVTERRASEDRMRRLSAAIDNMADTFYAVDSDERFLFVNKRAAEFYGKRAEDMVGDLIWPYFAPQNVPILRRLMEAGRATEKVQREQMSRGALWVQVALYPHGNEFLFFWQDITQAREAERSLAQKGREQSALAKFSVTAFQSEAGPEVKRAAAELAQVTLITDYAVVVEVDGAADSVRFVAMTGLPSETPRTFELSGLAPATLVAALVRDMRPVRAVDLGVDMDAAAAPLPAGLGIKNGIGAAAHAADGAIILLCTFTKEARNFTKGDGEFLQTMVNMIVALRDRRSAADTLRLRDRALGAITQGISMGESKGAFTPTVYINPAFARMSGYELHDVLGRGTEMFLANGLTPEQEADAVAAFAEKRPYFLETYVKRKDGSTFLDSMVSSPIVNRAGEVTHYVTVHEDFTQKRRDEALLKRKNAAQTALAEFTVAAFGSDNFTDLMKHAAALARTMLNADYTTIMDIDLADDSIQILGTHGWEVGERRLFKFSEWPENGLVPYCLRQGQPVRFSDIYTETRFVRDTTTDELGVRSGIVVMGTGWAQIRGFLSVLSREVREFTEDDVEFLQTLANVVGMLKERERNLTRLSLRDRALSSISQGIVVTDERHAHPMVIYANPALARMTGYSLEELIGLPSKAFLPPNPPPGLAEQLALARAKRREVRFDTQTKRKDGTTFLDHVSASPIVNAEGDLTHYVSIHEDITQARQRDERMHESQRMEAVGQLTGGIAHDFNNLLTVVRANAEDMRDELKDSPLLRRQADMVLQAATRGADLVQQLMAFARKQELEPKVVDLNAMLDSFTKLVGRTLQENVQIDVIKGKDIPPIKVDPGRLENALLNLSINARDAMPEGGTITIETLTATLDQSYAAENPGVRAGRYALIAISDTGTGMTKEVAEKAFQPFFTTKEVGQGTGLGLSMVYGFVRQSGGHAKIYSELGHGTTIKIYLPPTEGAVATESTSGRTIQVKGSGNVLLVEDDELVRESVYSKLLRLGYIVTPVCSAAEALETLEKNPHFDLVFTDVIMPGSMTGADLTRDVMRRWPGIKVLMTSGYTEASALGKVKMPEGVRLLSKPYSNADLAQAFRDVLEAAPAV